MKDKLSKALNEVRDSFIEEAASAKRPAWKWVPAVAAVLALVVGIWAYPQAPGPTPNGTTAGTVPNVTTGGAYPSGSSVGSTTVPNVAPPWGSTQSITLADYTRWEAVDAQGLAASLQDFFGKSMAATLGQRAGENKAYSPANLYMALSLLAELTGGEAELMTLLGADSLENLRQSANRLWNSTYLDGENKILLANSLWLESEGLRYNKAVIDTLSENYFSSVYRGDLGTPEADYAIAQWINAQTGDLLKDEAEKIQMDPDTAFALYSTLYYRVQWRDSFPEAWNIQDVFHGTTEATVTYMRKTEEIPCYRGSNFTAIWTGLQTGGMWLILPDAGVTPESLLERREYLDLVLGIDREHTPAVQVHLQLPKFDIQTSSSLVADIQSLGVSQIFDSMAGCFAGFLETGADGGVYVQRIDQATRVCVDEKGITAANFVGIQVPSDSVPPEEEVDFVLDRPFLYVITSGDDLPLFAGIVNDLS